MNKTDKINTLIDGLADILNDDNKAEIELQGFGGDGWDRMDLCGDTQTNSTTR